jgi:hypothetical protein
MNAKIAIAAYAQSEKIKAGLIWLSALLESYCEHPGCNLPVQDTTVNVLQQLFELILGEVHLAMRLNPDKLWQDVDRHMHTALIMMVSGVAHDSAYHLTKALACVTTIGQRALTFLNAQKHC